MNFKPEMIEKILSGEKTVTRRPRGGGKPCRYKQGRDYAICPGRGKHQVGRIWIVTVAPEFLIRLSIPEARAEGFASPDAFEIYWLKLYPATEWPAPVWRIEFRLLHPDDYSLWEGASRGAAA